MTDITYPLRVLCVPQADGLECRAIFDAKDEPFDIFAHMERIVACVNACHQFAERAALDQEQAVRFICDTAERIVQVEMQSKCTLHTLAALINQLGGSVNLQDIHFHALRPESFEIESSKDIDNRCTRIRVISKEQP